jgi:hypothetical protein
MFFYNYSCLNFFENYVYFFVTNNKKIHERIGKFLFSFLFCIAAIMKQLNEFFF